MTAQVQAFWQHAIPCSAGERISLTFRALREAGSEARDS